MALDDEERAELWREQRRRRALFQRWLWAEIAGDHEAARELYRKWHPLYLYLLERNLIDPDPEMDIGQPVPGMDETINVGRMRE